MRCEKRCIFNGDTGKCNAPNYIYAEADRIAEKYDVDVCDIGRIYGASWKPDAPHKQESDSYHDLEYLLTLMVLRAREEFNKKFRRW